MLYTRRGGGCSPKFRQNGPKQTRWPARTRLGTQFKTVSGHMTADHTIATGRMGLRSRLPGVVHNNGRIYRHSIARGLFAAISETSNGNGPTIQRCLRHATRKTRVNTATTAVGSTRPVHIPSLPRVHVTPYV